MPDMSELVQRRHSHSAASSPARLRPGGLSLAARGTGAHREGSIGQGGELEDLADLLPRLSSRCVIMPGLELENPSR